MHFNIASEYFWIQCNIEFKSNRTKKFQFFRNVKIFRMKNVHYIAVSVYNMYTYRQQGFNVLYDVKLKIRIIEITEHV